MLCIMRKYLVINKFWNSYLDFKHYNFPIIILLYCDRKKIEYRYQNIRQGNIVNEFIYKKKNYVKLILLITTKHQYYSTCLHKDDIK